MVRPCIYCEHTKNQYHRFKIVHQMNVKLIFLNIDLDEEIYMEQPESYVLLGNEQKVCKFVKSLYGLKQAPENDIKSLTLSLQYSLIMRRHTT